MFSRQQGWLPLRSIPRSSSNCLQRSAGGPTRRENRLTSSPTVPCPYTATRLDRQRERGEFVPFSPDRCSQKKAPPSAVALFRVNESESGLNGLGRGLVVALLLALSVAAVARIVGRRGRRVGIPDLDGSGPDLAAEARHERVHLGLADDLRRPGRRHVEPENSRDGGDIPLGQVLPEAELRQRDAGRTESDLGGGAINCVEVLGFGEFHVEASEIGRASCRERVEVRGVAVELDNTAE